LLVTLGPRDRHYHQQVHVAVRSGLASRVRSGQNDLLGTKLPDDPPHHSVNDRLEVLRFHCTTLEFTSAPPGASRPRVLGAGCWSLDLNLFFLETTLRSPFAFLLRSLPFLLVPFTFHPAPHLTPYPA